MRPGSALVVAVVVSTLLGVVPAGAASQEAGAVDRGDGTGFRFAFGWQDVAGDMADNLSGAVDAEFSFFVPVWRLRVGAGANWMSYGMDDYDESWSQIRFHLLAGYHFLPTARIRPYVEGRWTWQRLRPEDDRFYGGEDEILREFVASGPGWEGVAGVEVALGHRWAVDLSGGVGTYSVSPDISKDDPESLVPADSGIPWRIHAGIAWYPIRSALTGGGR
ncbi:MAG TPA: hypothetical protein VK858_04595 [Longimicrobiales bacterium]|nr:hypothetical protein [Longimicrobiales bacterium]